MSLAFTSTLKAFLRSYTLLFVVSLVNVNFCFAQNLGGSFTIDFGYLATMVKDTRHSSIFRTCHGGNSTLSYSIQGEKSANALGFGLSYAVADRDENIVTSVFAIEMRMFYEHLRTLRNKNWQLGAYIDYGVFLTDRDGGYWYGFDDDPSFSYVMWTSFGLSGKYQKSLGENWLLNVKTALPLFAFTERPAYAFVFPEDHYVLKDYYSLLLQSEYFERAQFRPFTQFTNLQFQTGLQRKLGQRGNSIGFNYKWNYLFAGGVKPLFKFNHQLGIALSI